MAPTIIDVTKNGAAPTWLPRHLVKFAKTLEVERAIGISVKTGNVEAVEELTTLGGLGNRDTLIAQAKLNCELREAVDKLDLPAVKRLLKQGADPMTKEVGRLGGLIRSFPLILSAGWVSGGVRHGTPEGSAAFEIGVELAMRGAMVTAAHIGEESWIDGAISRTAFERRFSSAKA